MSITSNLSDVREDIEFKLFWEVYYEPRVSNLPYKFKRSKNIVFTISKAIENIRKYEKNRMGTEYTQGKALSGDFRTSVVTSLKTIGTIAQTFPEDS